MKYKVYRISIIDICVPSTDYYARQGEWEKDYTRRLKEITPEIFDSQEDAINWLKKQTYKGEYTILPIYII